MKELKISKDQIVFLSLIIISAFLLSINFIPIFVVNEGITTQFSDNLWPDRESFVNESDPDVNYDIFWLDSIIGNSCETYIHFNLESIPQKAKELCFFINSHRLLNTYSFPIEDIEINLILVESNWSTSEITWNNKPKHEEIIDTVNISSIIQGYFIKYYNFERAINLTEVIKNNHLNEISLCINITENNIGLNDSVALMGIQLIWNYEQLLISNTTIITSCIIFSMLIGILLYARKDIFSCQSCETKRKLTEKFCSSCRNEFEKHIIDKGADYQLILSLLWIFALFEVSFLIWAWLVYQFTGGVLPLLPSIIFINWTIIALVQIVLKIKKYRRIRALLK